MIVYKGRESRVVHPQRFENILLNELLVGLSADPFQQVSEHDVAQIGVGPSFAGLKVQRFVIKDQLVRGAGFILGGVVGDAGCVR